MVGWLVKGKGFLPRRACARARRGVCARRAAAHGKLLKAPCDCYMAHERAGDVWDGGQRELTAADRPRAEATIPPKLGRRAAAPAIPTRAPGRLRPRPRAPGCWRGMDGPPAPGERSGDGLGSSAGAPDTAHAPGPHASCQAATVCGVWRGWECTGGRWLLLCSGCLAGAVQPGVCRQTVSNLKAQRKGLMHPGPLVRHSLCLQWNAPLRPRGGRHEARRRP
jgi:hypothetical protein